MADIATAPTITNIAGEIVEREGQKSTRVCLLSATGDASGVTGTPATNWWKAVGFSSVHHIIAMEPLTAATPDEDEFHLFKFSSDFGTIYFGDAHGGGPMSATDFTAKIKVIGTT